MPALLVLIGPTGVGKTELSLQLAEMFRTCIVSADSRQLYADLKIGTAAPTPEQLARVRHYFVGTLQLTDYYSAARYEEEVMKLLPSLFQEQEVVVLTGGSMMYVDAVCKGIDDMPTVDGETRQLMMRRYETEGLDALCAELRLRDPERVHVRINVRLHDPDFHLIPQKLHGFFQRGGLSRPGRRHQIQKEHPLFLQLFSQKLRLPVVIRKNALFDLVYLYHCFFLHGIYYLTSGREKPAVLSENPGAGKPPALFAILPCGDTIGSGPPARRAVVPIT